MCEHNDIETPLKAIYRCPITNLIHARSVEIMFNPKRRFSHYVNLKKVNELLENDPQSFKKITNTIPSKRGWYFHEKYLTDYINWLLKE